MATLKEISELTGYSIATISRVLNHDVSLSVTDSTREEILRVAAGGFWAVSVMPRHFWEPWVL